jgi:hypothetical protein
VRRQKGPRQWRGGGERKQSASTGAVRSLKGLSYLTPPDIARDGLSSIFPNLGKGNAIWDFPDKKLSLRCSQALCDQVLVNAQTQLCLRFARRFGLNHDLGQHGSPTAFHRFV